MGASRVAQRRESCRPSALSEVDQPSLA